MKQISTGLHIVWSLYLCFDNIIGPKSQWLFDYFYTYTDKVVVECYREQKKRGLLK